MKRPEQSAPRPVDKDRVSLARLDVDLAAFEARRRKAPAGLGSEAGAGYRLLGQMLGGVLGGIGLGWLVDHFAHTGPWGVVLGLLIGSGLSIYSTVRTASRMGTQAKPGPIVRPSDDDDDV